MCPPGSTMDGGKRVWVPHPIEGFKLGRIIDIGSDTISIEPFDAPGTVGSVVGCLFLSLSVCLSLSYSLSLFKLIDIGSDTISIEPFGL